MTCDGNFWWQNSQRNGQSKGLVPRVCDPLFPCELTFLPNVRPVSWEWAWLLSSTGFVSFLGYTDYTRWATEFSWSNQVFSPGIWSWNQEKVCNVIMWTWRWKFAIFALWPTDKTASLKIDDAVPGQNEGSLEVWWVCLSLRPYWVLPPPWPVCIFKNGKEVFGIEVLNQNFPSSSWL